MTEALCSDSHGGGSCDFGTRLAVSGGGALQKQERDDHLGRSLPLSETSRALGRTGAWGFTQAPSPGAARENPFHVSVCGAWRFRVPQRRLMLLKHRDNLAVFGIRRFSISWACCICWFIWQEKHWFTVMPSTSQVKQKNILIVVMCCHLYTRETIRENLPNFLCKLSLGCSVTNEQTVSSAFGSI